MTYTNESDARSGLMAKVALGVCLLSVSPALDRSNGQTAAVRSMAGSNLQGSTIVSNPTAFQLELIYKKFPTTVAVTPNTPWQLSFGVLLTGAPPSTLVTLTLDPAEQNADVQIVDGSATFVLDGAMNHNYDAAERFEILYTGPLDPFVGPIDFLLEPAGLPPIPVRVHLGVIEQPGYPIPFVTTTNATAPTGDVIGDNKLEIVVPGGAFGSRGLFAFDHAGTPLPGWPLQLTDPDILDQSFSSPALVDLDHDGKDDVVVVGLFQRNVLDEAATAGFVFTTSLFVVDGTGSIRWQVEDSFVPSSVPTVADLNGDEALDILVGGSGNLMRFNESGIRLAGWQVETLNDITVDVPVIGDVDGIPGNGLQIVACSPLPGLPRSTQVYVWNQDGSLHDPAWPKTLERCFAPVVVDLDGDLTNGREIVMAIHHEQPEVDPGTGFRNTFTVFAWHADGTDVIGWPHRFMRSPTVTPDDRIVSSPSADDLDGDGDMEVVVGTYGQGDQANGNLFVFHHDGTLDPNWPQWAGTAQTPAIAGGRALGDLDNDGVLEIVTGSGFSVNVLRMDGTQFEGFPKLTSDNFGQPMIADIDRDGRLEIVVVSLLDFVSSWKVLTASAESDPWPRFRQNAARTGTSERVLPAPIPTVSEVGLVAMICLLLGAGVCIIRRNASTLP